jgi:hypothetical protein
MEPQDLVTRSTTDQGVLEVSEGVQRLNEHPETGARYGDLQRRVRELSEDFLAGKVEISDLFLRMLDLEGEYERLGRTMEQDAQSGLE